MLVCYTIHSIAFVRTTSFQTIFEMHFFKFVVALALIGLVHCYQEDNDDTHIRQVREFKFGNGNNGRLPVS